MPSLPIKCGVGGAHGGGTHPRVRGAQTYRWPRVLQLARSAEPGAPPPLMGPGDRGGPWDPACPAPQASPADPSARAPQAPPRCPAVPGSRGGPGGPGVRPCLVGRWGLGPHWGPEGRASRGTRGSLWGPAGLWSLCRHALQGGRPARSGPSHRPGREGQAPPSLLSVPCCQWDPGVPAVLCHLSDPWGQEDLKEKKDKRHKSEIQDASGHLGPFCH